MKKSELKLRLVSGVNNLIDDYFGSGTMSDNMINATLKIIVRQNEYKLDGMLDLFADETGDIDSNVIVEEYSKVLGNDGIIIDIRDFIKSSTIRHFLPDKSLMVKKDDIKRMLM